MQIYKIMILAKSQTPAFYAALDIDYKRLVLGMVNYGWFLSTITCAAVPRSCALTTGWVDEILRGPKEFCPPGC